MLLCEYGLKVIHNILSAIVSVPVPESVQEHLGYQVQSYSASNDFDFCQCGHVVSKCTTVHHFQLQQPMGSDDQLAVEAIFRGRVIFHGENQTVWGISGRVYFPE